MPVKKDKVLLWCPICIMPYSVSPGHVKYRKTCSQECANIKKSIVYTGKGFYKTATIEESLKKRAEGFWQKVEKKDYCWEWKASRSICNYGQFWFMGKMVRAHRFSWILHYSAIPEGKYILHKCDNPGCVNPEHLYVGTAKDNYNDMMKKGRAAKEYIKQREIIHTYAIKGVKGAPKKQKALDC